MKNLGALSCDVSPRAGGQSIRKATLIAFVIHDASDGLMNNGKQPKTGGGNGLGTRLWLLNTGSILLVYQNDHHMFHAPPERHNHSIHICGTCILS